MTLNIKQGSRLFLSAALIVPALARADDKAVEPALVVRAVGPDRQAEAVLKLFEGSKAPSPAAAMANWRRATGNPDGLPKAVQAVAAMFNPEMVAEWRAFRDVVLAVRFEPNGAMQWSAVAPHDDGTLAAMVTSMRLSGGGDEPPLAGTPVERMGEEGSALAAVTPRGTAFASRRAELAGALDRLSKQEPEPSFDLLALTPEDSGFRFVLDPSRLVADPARSVIPSQVVAGLKAAGLKTSAGFLSLRGDRLGLDLASRFAAERPAMLDTPAIDPTWLSWFPVDSTLAAVALATGRGAAFWDSLFEIADRIDRADPDRAQLQPLRVRINLMATLRGVRPEVDLWPLLRGVSAGVVLLGDPNMPVGVGVVVALHAERPEDAERIHRRVIQPALAGRERFADQPIKSIVRGGMVLVGWGEGAIATALKSAEAPEQSAATLIGRDDHPISRAGVFRPSVVDVTRFDGADLALTVMLAQSEFIVWKGGWAREKAWDVVRWGDLKRSVARFLEIVPQAPPEAP
ncbi:hypothetical protein [Paludisphaera rhizosphaerae]|uniref:hypothetical protein n=1 Tax=Paludisphaera rhizosphaerae TaxID=2711216 RepID=UPI0013ECBC30|nr:hypothetical protein [Paludisphaera rhizosphaerae]